MPAHRTPDVCRFCRVPLTDENWPAALRHSGHAKVCQDHARDFYRQKNIKSAPAQRRHYVEKRRVRYAALRAEGIGAYGGKCACCGETTFEFLTIDHVRNDGKQHRRAL